MQLRTCSTRLAGEAGDAPQTPIRGGQRTPEVASAAAIDRCTEAGKIVSAEVDGTAEAIAQPSCRGAVRCAAKPPTAGVEGRTIRPPANSAVQGQPQSAKRSAAKLQAYLRRIEWGKTVEAEFGKLFKGLIQVSSKLIKPGNAAQKAFVKENPGAVIVQITLRGKLKGGLSALGPLAAMLGKTRLKAATTVVIELPIVAASTKDSTLQALTGHIRTRLMPFAVSSAAIEIPPGTRFAVTTELDADSDIALPQLAEHKVGVNVAAGVSRTVEIVQLAGGRRKVAGETKWITGLKGKRARKIDDMRLSIAGQGSHTVVRKWSAELSLEQVKDRKARARANTAGTLGPKLLSRLGIPWQQDWEVTSVVGPEVGATVPIPMAGMMVKMTLASKSERLVKVKLPDKDHRLSIGRALTVAAELMKLDLNSLALRAPDGTSVVQYFAVEHGAKLNVGVAADGFRQDTPGLKIKAGVDVAAELGQDSLVRLEVTRKQGKTFARLQRKAYQTRAWSIFAGIKKKVSMANGMAAHLPDMATMLQQEYVRDAAKPLLTDAKKFVEQALSVYITQEVVHKKSWSDTFDFGPWRADSSAHVIAFDKLKTGKEQAAIDEGLVNRFKQVRGRGTSKETEARLTKIGDHRYATEQSLKRTVTGEKTVRGIDRSGELEGHEWVRKASNFLGFGEKYVSHFPLVTEMGTDGVAKTVAEGYYWIRDTHTRQAEYGYWQMWTRELGLQVEVDKHGRTKLASGEGALYWRVNDQGIRRLLQITPQAFAQQYLRVASRYYGGQIPPSERAGKIPFGLHGVGQARKLLRGYDWTSPDAPEPEAGDDEDYGDKHSGKQWVRDRFRERYGMEADTLAAILRDYIDPFAVANAAQRARLMADYRKKFGGNLYADFKRVQAADLLNTIKNDFSGDEDFDDAVEEYKKLTGRPPDIDLRIISDAEQLRFDMAKIQQEKSKADALMRTEGDRDDDGGEYEEHPQIALTHRFGAKKVLGGLNPSPANPSAAYLKRLERAYKRVYKRVGDLAKHSRPGASVFSRRQEEAFAIKTAALLSMLRPENRRVWLNYKSNGHELLARDPSTAAQPERLKTWLKKVQ